MPDKDINIHVRAKGTGQTKREVDSVAGSTRKMGRTTEDTGSKMQRVFGRLAGMLGFTGLATTAIAAGKKIVQALNDIKAAADDAVKSLAELQKQSTDLFEAVEAYGPGEQKEALKMAHKLTFETGLGLPAAQSLLAEYKRAYGKIDLQGVRQFAAWEATPGGAPTAPLVRWMSAEGISSPGQQGQILRMISTVARRAGLSDQELAEAITQRSTEFRALGWSPEQAIQNLGTVLSGVSGREARRAISGLGTGFMAFTEEKAREYKVPPKIAGDAQARMAWAAMTLSKASPAKQAQIAKDLFGQEAAPFVTKLLTMQMPPETLAAIEFAKSAAAAEESEKQLQEYLQTPQGIMAKVKAQRGIMGLDVLQEETYEAAIREFGAGRLDWLKRRDRLNYEIIKLAFLSEGEKEQAAMEAWAGYQAETIGGPTGRYYKQWRGMRPEEQWGALEAMPTGGGTVIINNYSYDTHHYPPRQEARPRFVQD